MLASIGIGRADPHLSQDSCATLDRMTLLLAALFVIPLFHSSHAPPIFRTRIDTTAGSFVIETHRDWSPKGADRFYQLVRKHYYDDSRFFRVVPGRWVQFGISGDPKVAQAWRHKTIPDDTLKVHNAPGYVAFSNTGPGTRSTQVYINLRENSGSGMRAGHQDKLFEGGNAYMDKEFPRLDHLIRATIISDK